MAGEISATTARGWLYSPEFPHEWGREPLYSLAEWVNGLAFRDIQFSPSGRPVIKIAEIKDGISDQTRFTDREFDRSVFVQNGDMLFSWSGQPETSIDAFWWRGPDGWLNQHVFRVTPSNRIDRTFFYYLLRYLRPNFIGIAQNKQTTGLGHVTKRDLQNIEVAYPAPPEQRAIGGVLGALDDKIELNRRMNETLEAMARALFKSWFVDFDPVRAKAEARAPGLHGAAADFFPDGFIDSEEAGEVPAGWRTGTLLVFALLNPEVWSRERYPEVIHYVDLSNTKWGRIEAVTLHDGPSAPSRAQRVLRPGDTIVGTVRPGNGSYALIAEDGLTGSTGFAMLRPRCPQYAEFVYLAATAPENIEALAHLADGAAYPAVRPEVVAATPVTCPGHELMMAFSHAAQPLLARMATNERQSRTLAALRDALLPKLISGEIRVKEAERLVADAAG